MLRRPCRSPCDRFVFAIRSCWRESGRFGGRHVLVEPFGKRGECRMRQRALQIAPYARHVTKILRLAIALVEPREDTQNLAGALGGEGDVELEELGAGEIGIGGP